MIKAVESFILHVPVTGSRIADSTHSVTHWGVVGAKITSEEGLTGYGFTGTHAHLPSDRLIAAAITDCYAPLLLSLKDRSVLSPGAEVAAGADGCFRPSAVYDALFRHPPLQWVGRSGILQLALSAVDTALWDIYAKRSGLPLWKLLGGPAREALPAYNTDIGWLSFSAEELVENARNAVSEGFRGIKLKVGLPNLRDDIARIEKVRSAVGSGVTIAVDANGKWDLPTAIRFSRETEALDLLWMEEPLWYDDVDAHEALARSASLPIALGEQIYTPMGMAQFISRRAVHFVQPDVTRIGGVSGFLEAAACARSASLPIAAHAGDMSQVHVHLAYALKEHTALEYIPWIARCFEDPARVRGGNFVRPEKPGAGTTPTAKAMEEYRAG